LKKKPERLKADSESARLTKLPRLPLEADFQRAVSFLGQGKIVAFPTETFYGLAVDPFNEQALTALFRLKHRALHKPFPLLINDEAQLADLTSSIPGAYNLLIKTFWPGSLTLVFPAGVGLSSMLTGGDSGGIGIRVSSNPVAGKFCRLWGRPMTATSANISGMAAARTAEEVRQFLGDGVDYILDGGQTPGGMSSTVVGLKNGELQLLRKGPIDFSALNQAIGQLKHSVNLGKGQNMDDLCWNKEFAMGQVDNDEELLQELLTIFKDSSASDLAVLKQAVEKGAPVEARGPAHSIKGAAASLGLEAIRDITAAIEKDCREGSVAVAREKLPRLEILLVMAAEL
jgi:L-threonylcarbamoyladenylate synthase